MAEIYNIKLTATEKEKILAQIEKYTYTNNQGCKKWKKSKNSLTSDGYGRLRVTFRGKRIWLRAHKISYYIHNDCPEIGNHHISHLCHKRRCVNPIHLSREPAQINSNRESCRLDGACHGHHGYMRCII